MKLNFIKSTVLIAFALILNSCTDKDTHVYSNTSSIQTYELTTTVSASSVISTNTTSYLNDDLIEAYVTSNDAAGNFYKSISFQTVPTDQGTPKGFSVAVDKSMLFGNGFTPGRKVYIKLKGLAIANVYGSPQIGLSDNTSSTGIGKISELDFQKYLFPSATILDESRLVRTVTLSQASNDTMQNTLLDITNIEFADSSLSRTYYDINNGGYATNHNIFDYVNGGAQQVCRFSQYALFSTNLVPSGRGTIRGVMTKYNSTFQFTVREEKDVINLRKETPTGLINPRNYTFFSTLNENFSSYTIDKQASFQNYLNFANVGTKNWMIKASLGALEMTSYGGVSEYSKCYFVIPVDMTTASTFKFDIKAGYYTNGLGLRVYRSMDYVPGMKITDATLADISTSFNLPSASTTAFASSGVYNIPATITGNGYFIFEYSGNNIATGPPITTTVDIDNIVIQ